MKRFTEEELQDWGEQHNLPGVLSDRDSLVLPDEPVRLVNGHEVQLEASTLMETTFCFGRDEHRQIAVFCDGELVVTREVTYDSRASVSTPLWVYGGFGVLFPLTAFGAVTGLPVLMTLIAALGFAGLFAAGPIVTDETPEELTDRRTNVERYGFELGTEPSSKNEKRALYITALAALSYEREYSGDRSFMSEGTNANDDDILSFYGPNFYEFFERLQDEHQGVLDSMRDNLTDFRLNSEQNEL